LLTALLDDAVLAARIGAAGREAAVSIFGAATVADEWRAALARIVAMGRPADA
jgi:hypothetical protein